MQVSNEKKADRGRDFIGLVYEEERRDVLVVANVEPGRFESFPCKNQFSRKVKNDQQQMLLDVHVTDFPILDYQKRLYPTMEGNSSRKI